MTGKAIFYYLLVAFILGNILLIYIQYNSGKNINTLIGDNQKVLAEIDVSNNLRELNRDITLVESNIEGSSYSKDSSNEKGLEKKIKKVQSDIDDLQKISDDDTSVIYIDILDLLVHKKLLSDRYTLDSMHLPAGNTIGLSIASSKKKELDDSIRMVTRIIESSRQKLLAKITTSTDKSGKKALNLGITLISIVLLSGAVLFWVIISIMRKQNLLIQQLNISEKKVRESAQVKEKFMANVSHEIRTPMNAILGFTNLLQRKNLDEDAKEYVQIIHKSGENLLNIINDVLDLSKIEAGMMQIESAPFNIRGLLHSVENMFKSKAGDKKIELNVHVDEALPDILEGDATRLTQILINLIGNSLKFTNIGIISIKVSNEGKTGSVINTGITVSDTGIGIEKEKLQYIFERFRQAEDSVTRNYGGTGLGLSIVKDLVLLQNGNIDVQSEYGAGTSFHLTIPYKIPAEHLAGKLSGESHPETGPGFEHVVVLVVEDNEINQSLIKHLFKNWQLDFDLVNNGKESIEQLKLKRYDLILMDIQMPEMDGYTATREIRGTLKLDTPIVAMTAHALAGEREKCLSYGMNEYISKPIREELLYKLISQLTQMKYPGALKKKINLVAGNYRVIDLQYMKEVSGGNTEYEKTVTGQFIEAIPRELSELENAWQRNDINQLKQLAHNMRTTVSVMGLTGLLQPYLDAIELENINDGSLNEILSSLKSICRSALEEAEHFYATF